MNHIFKIGLVLICMLPSLSYAEESPEELFERYEQLAKSFDSSIGSLYFDDAKVHAYRVYPHGLERTMEFTGASRYNNVLVFEYLS
jgi:SPX domain protein involved in polyphosphate accumulation